MKNTKIDLVVLWVDGNDPEWQAEKCKYSSGNQSDSSIYRYRDWDLMRYWFRGVEKFAPWVNNIFFITWKNVPEWLNKNHPKLKIIKHSDFIPKKYLPTFNSHTIELNIHRIKELSEHFILANDDTFFIDKTHDTDFFDKNGNPKDSIALNVHCPQREPINQYFSINNTSIINEHFDFKKTITTNFSKWFNIKNGPYTLRTLMLTPCPRFPGFWQHHLINSYSKKTFKTIWKKEYNTLDLTCSHKFREITDVNQWLIKDWTIALGNFSVRSYRFGRSFYIDRDGYEKVGDKICRYVRKQSGKVIAINDGYMTDTDFNNLLKKLNQSFQTILPDKSEFEI